MNKQSNLASNTLGTLESFVMGIAGTAPAFSVAVTTASIVAAVGVQSIGSIFYCGLIMFGIMLAFKHLGKEFPSAGATYTWIKEVFGASWGFFAGWAMLVASVLFMVSATIPAATSTLLIFFPEHVEDTAWVAFVASIWLTLVTAVVTKGIKQSSYVQVTITLIETIILFALIAASFSQFGHTPMHPISWDWVSPYAMTPEVFATGALIAIFFYWGWDVTMNLGEETKQDETNPAGKGAFWAMVNLILFFVIMITAIFLVLSDDEISKANTNVLYALADKLFPYPFNYLAVLSTILSTLGTIETQIIQFSRGLFAMSRDEMLHPRYSKIHANWQTPYIATVTIYIFGIFLLISSSFLPSVKVILDSSISAIGVQICFYMGVAGLAAAWHFKDVIFKESILESGSKVIWPFLSSCFMIFLGVYCLPTFDTLTLTMGIGGLAIGIIPLILNVRK
jgi:amino acid transporter